MLSANNITNQSSFFLTNDISALEFAYNVWVAKYLPFSNNVEQPLGCIFKEVRKIRNSFSYINLEAGAS